MQLQLLALHQGVDGTDGVDQFLEGLLFGQGLSGVQVQCGNLVGQALQWQQAPADGPGHQQGDQWQQDQRRQHDVFGQVGAQVLAPAHFGQYGHPARCGGVGGSIGDKNPPCGGRAGGVQYQCVVALGQVGW